MGLFKNLFYTWFLDDRLRNDLQRWWCVNYGNTGSFPPLILNCLIQLCWFSVALSQSSVTHVSSCWLKWGQPSGIRHRRQDISELWFMKTRAMWSSSPSHYQCSVTFYSTFLWQEWYPEELRQTRCPRTNEFAFCITQQVFVCQLRRVSFSTFSGASSRCSAQWSKLSPPSVQPESPGNCCKLRECGGDAGGSGCWHTAGKEDGERQRGLGRACCHWSVRKQVPASRDVVSRAGVVHNALMLPHLFALDVLYWKN